MDPATETRHRELRAHGRRLTGTVMQYGDEALIPGIGVERFAAFAFAAYLGAGAGTALNLQHDDTLTIGSTGDVLTLTDSPAELRMVATLPAGDAYDSVLALIGDRLATGLRSSSARSRNGGRRTPGRFSGRRCRRSASWTRPRIPLPRWSCAPRGGASLAPSPTTGRHHRGPRPASQAELRARGVLLQLGTVDRAAGGSRRGDSGRGGR